MLVLALLTDQHVWSLDITVHYIPWHQQADLTADHYSAKPSDLPGSAVSSLGWCLLTQPDRKSLSLLGALTDVGKKEMAMSWHIQWSFYFKTNHGTMKMWSYIAGGLKTNFSSTQNSTVGQNRWSCNQGGLKIKGCKIE